jgi:hypothetical protein
VSSAERISDEFTALLCRGLGAARRSGDKTAWWWQIGVDPTKWPWGSLAHCCPLSRRSSGTGCGRFANEPLASHGVPSHIIKWKARSSRGWLFHRLPQCNNKPSGVPDKQIQKINDGSTDTDTGG